MQEVLRRAHDLALVGIVRIVAEIAGNAIPPQGLMQASWTGGLVAEFAGGLAEEKNMRSATLRPSEHRQQRSPAPSAWHRSRRRAQPDPSRAHAGDAGVGPLRPLHLRSPPAGQRTGRPARRAIRSRSTAAPQCRQMSLRDVANAHHVQAGLHVGRQPSPRCLDR